METVKFISMLGTEVRIFKDLLSKSYVETAAQKHFKQAVVCIPCVFGTGSVAVGWRIENQDRTKVIGYMSLITGDFRDFPDDFEYGITTVVPLSNQWAYFFDYKVRYVDDVMEICPN